MNLRSETREQPCTPPQTQGGGKWRWSGEGLHKSLLRSMNRFICWWNGEHLIVSRIEPVGLRLEHTLDYCRRCGWKRYTLKGYWMEIYRNGPTEFTELYGEALLKPKGVSRRARH